MLEYNRKNALNTAGTHTRANERDLPRMDFGEIYHFLFETFYGIGCLVAIGLVVSFIVCIILERKTRSIYKNHEKTEDDWSLFDDDDDEEEGEA